MKHLDLSENKVFKRIYQEEISKVKRRLEESYNEDKIWDSMTDQDRFDAILSVTDDTAAAERYSKEIWDLVPDDITDNIDMSQYRLAKGDFRFGEPLLRGIKNMRDIKFKDDPDFEKIKTSIQKLIDQFTKKTGRSFENLTSKQAKDLNIKVQHLIGKFKPMPEWDPNAGSDIKSAELDRLRKQGKSYGFD